MRNAVKKRMEIDQAEKNYVAGHDAPDIRPSTSQNPVANIFNKSVYMSKVDEMANGPHSEKKANNSKIQYY